MYILCAVVIVFACMGLSEFLHLLWMKIISPKTKAKTFYVVRLKSGEAKEQLNFSGMQTHWLGRSYSEYRIASYGEEFSAEEKSECKALAERYDIICCPAGLEGRIIEVLSSDTQ